MEAAYFEDLIHQYDIPGMTIAFVEGDKIIYIGAHGLKASDSDDPLGRQTIFEAASLSKPLFAYAVMQLVANGKPDLV